MEACQTYELTYTNNLEGSNPGGEWNTMKDPNTTNIHTHGLHISGESPADDVLYVQLTPGKSHTCEDTNTACCQDQDRARKLSEQKQTGNCW